jgi:transposase
MAAHRTKPSLVLAPVDQERLEHVVKSRTEPVRRVERAQILLGYAAGESIPHLVHRLGFSLGKVTRCVDKALSFGPMEALDDLPRPGRPVQIPPTTRAWIVGVACQKPKDLGYAAEVWTERSLAAHIRAHAVAEHHPTAAQISPGTISKLLAAQDLHPHRVHYYCERRDPAFEQKMVQVLHVYQQVEWEFAHPDHQTPGVVRLSYDEKPGIQAIGPTAADRPPVPGQHGTWTRDYEYVRHGTVSLLAGLDLATGQVIGLVRDRHRSREFIEFLQALDAQYPPDTTIQIILDNHSAHTSKETRAYLQTVPNRFQFIFTPVHGSWLNLVESFFAKMTHQVLRHMQVHSVDELRTRLERYLEEVNADPVRFRWKNFNPLHRPDNVSAI